MDGFFNTKVARNSSLFLNIIFMLIHISFFVYFSVFGIVLMKNLNIISILIYLTGYYIIKKGYIRIWFYMMAHEVIIHMGLATICLGTDYGFQLCLIGMVVIYFYAEYFTMKVHRYRISATGVSILSIVVYFFTEIWVYFRGVIYTINPDVAICTKLGNITAIFLINIVLLRMLITYSFSIEDRLAAKAECDELTKLFNRHYMMQVFEDIFENNEADKYWIAMIDIDDFKVINDTYGHNRGDEVLKVLADILRKNGEKLNLCRWGGEEFMLVGRLSEQGRIVEKVLMDIMEDVRKTDIAIDDNKISFTITIGAAAYLENQTLDEWINRADKNLYVGKYNGKNQIVC